MASPLLRRSASRPQAAECLPPDIHCIPPDVSLRGAIRAVPRKLPLGAQDFTLIAQITRRAARSSFPHPVCRTTLYRVGCVAAFSRLSAPPCARLRTGLLMTQGAKGPLPSWTQQPGGPVVFYPDASDSFPEGRHRPARRRRGIELLNASWHNMAGKPPAGSCPACGAEIGTDDRPITWTGRCITSAAFRTARALWGCATSARVLGPAFQRPRLSAVFRPSL
jgi:hypothetical protein